MLQQILKDMWVDPEILAELDDQQKQTLFCKMREEQVRRWKIWDQNQPDQNYSRPEKACKKSVSFMKGSDGEPWVWVMGEHKNDKSIEQILKEEAIEKARKLAEKEAEELRKHLVEAELSEYIELSPKKLVVDDMVEECNKGLNIQNTLDIYCSVDELREKMVNNKPISKNINHHNAINNVTSNNAKNNIINSNYSLNHYQSKNKFNVIEPREVLQEIDMNAVQKVSQKVALWEKKLTEERTCEIFQRIQKKHLETAKEAEEQEMKQEEFWMEQERKAKQAELQIREIARRAREEHRKAAAAAEKLHDSQSNESNNSSITTPATPPSGKQAVLDWYHSNELPRGAGIDTTNNVEPWFHGLITRLEAETLLADQSDGSFLVRLSERIWGYAITYKSKEKCKHYLVDASQKYKFLGSNQLEHDSLGALIEHHRQYPLSGGEKLLQSCPRTSESALLELLGLR